MISTISSADGLRLRQEYLKKARRVVVKVGSAVLTGSTGLNTEVMTNLARQLSALRNDGLEVILVSSGAVAAGRRKLALGDRSISLKEKQAVAAAGQSHLMRVYEDIFGQFDQKIAQVLLTRDDLSHRSRYLNVRNTLFTLLQWGLIPVINENDTVSVEELRFGDNDTLGAMITNLTEADLFLCLTDVAGLYTGNPSQDPSAVRLSTVDRVTTVVEAMAGNVQSALGTGGMQSKIKAARMVSDSGGCSFIGPGKESEVISRLFKGEDVGTFFLPSKAKLKSRKHWISYTLRPKGDLVLDSGACRALIGGGKSLLPSGICQVNGRFGPGDPVRCLNDEGELIGVGLVNYRSSDIDLIKGLKSSLIEQTLGYKDSDEVIHRDNFVIAGEKSVE
ncbi:MAG: glutamate 5-kinase [Proteobacteria bacterium]|nr:glutamate 5-kinase [Pseudomonadota bacterium]MBU1687288.1 glutamate 5-kinase [Pseudomonadota bacterium]